MTSSRRSYRARALLACMVLGFAACRSPISSSLAADVGVRILIPRTLQGARAVSSSSGTDGSGARFIHPDSGYVEGAIRSGSGGSSTVVAFAATAIPADETSVTLAFEDVPVGQSLYLTVDLYESGSKASHLGHVEKGIEVASDGSLVAGAASGGAVTVAPVAGEGLTVPLGVDNAVTIASSRAGETLVYQASFAAAGTCRARFYTIAGEPLEGLAVYDSTGTELACLVDGDSPCYTRFNKAEPGPSLYYLAVTVPADASGDMRLDMRVFNTITFNANGGVGDDTTVDVDDQAALPACDFNREGYVFKGWSTSAGAIGAEVEWPDEGTYTAGATDRTLYAIWREYAVGDAGPAGGVIFHDAGGNITVNGQTFRYLEYATAALNATNPRGLRDPVGSYPVWTSVTDSIVGTQAGIGYGKGNTELIVAAYPADTYGAAYICSAYSSGGYDDWFLPSIDEMAVLWDYARLSGAWWSSTQSSANTATASVRNGVGTQNYPKADDGNALPVRAFAFP